MNPVLSPFMLLAHRFAVGFQGLSLILVADLHARFPEADGLGMLIGWIAFFGAYSTFALSRHRRAMKVKAEQDKSAKG